MMPVDPEVPAGPTQVARPAAAPATVRVAGQALLDTTSAHVAANLAGADSPAFPTIPGYEILAELGRGGMGVVFKARHERLGRVVALKMLRESTFAGPVERKRFLAEAATLAQLRHPHIVQIFDFGEHAGAAYFTLEYLEGGSLDRATLGQPQAPAAAARLVEQLARAVQVAHDQGIVHRDLKPANVLMDTAPLSHHGRPSPAAADAATIGHPKVTDFGIAKHAHLELTATQALLGTPSYMSPEQAAGRTRDIGPATDIHALGAILYELLVGNPPFRGTTVLETLEQVRQKEPVPPRRLQPKLSRDLETICLKCLAKDPRRRYARAADLADDLNRWLGGEPIHARPVGPVELGLNWARRRPTAAALILVSLLAVMGVVAASVGLVYNARLAASLEQTEVARREAEAHSQRAAAALNLAETYAGFHRTALAEQAWEEANPLRMQALLEGIPPNQRGWEWKLLDRRAYLDMVRLEGHQGSADRVQFSPDGRWLVSTSLVDREVRLWDPDTGAFVRRWPGTFYSDRHIFSPDGRALLISSNKERRLQCVDIATGKVTAEVHVPDYRADGAQWAPDGSGWITMANNGDLVVLQPRSGTLLRRLPGLRSQQYREFSRTGGVIAVLTGPSRRTLRLCRYPDETLVAEIALPAAHLWSVVLDAEGRRVAASFDNHAVYVWDVPSQRLLTVFHGHAGNVYGIDISPDGRWIASASRDRTVKLWHAATGQEVATLRGHTASVHAVAFHPYRPLLASCGRDRVIRLWDLTRVPEAVAFQFLGSGLFGLTFNPTGTEIASIAFDGSVRGARATASTPKVTWHAACPAALPPSFSDAVQFINKPVGAFLQGVAYRPTGHVAARVMPPPNVIQLLDLTAGTARTIPGKGQTTWAVAFTPDGKRVVTGTQEGRVELWDIAQGTMLARSPNHDGPVVGLAFSPDGRTLLSAGRHPEVRLLDPETLAERGRLVGHADAVFQVAVSRDGRWAATASKDQLVLVWNLAERRVVHRLVGHAGPVLGVAFSPDGTRLASCGGDQAIQLWDVATGQETLTLRGHDDYVTAVAWSPDGLRLATGGLDGKLRVWDASGESRQAWQAQRRGTDAETLLHWHQHQAWLAANESLPLAAAWHVMHGDWRWGFMWSLLRP